MSPSVRLRVSPFIPVSVYVCVCVRVYVCVCVSVRVCVKLNSSRARNVFSRLNSDVGESVSGLHSSSSPPFTTKIKRFFWNLCGV